MLRFPLKISNYSKIKLIVSDLHLSAGVFTRQGEKNSYESFFFDQEFSDLLEHFSSNRYGEGHPVELILNGDILDFLNVSYKAISFNFISEKIALYKLKKILNGHKLFFNSLKKFISKPDKTITYIIGNHDADMFFKKLQNYFKEEIGGVEFKDKINFIDQTEFYQLDGNIEVHHGNQFETIHRFDYSNLFIEDKKGRKLLSLPWGSLFIMNVISKFKKDRDYIDNIYPHSIFMLYSIVTDPAFAIHFMFYTAWYFIKTRLVYLRYTAKVSILKLPTRVREDLHFLEDGESSGRSILKEKPETFAVIMGHTHRPKEVRYPSGQMYINTGTWTKTVNLDLRYFGRSVRQPFCLIAYPKKADLPIQNQNPHIMLLEWKGSSGLYRHFIP